jgi:hypothetical protein
LNGLGGDVNLFAGQGIQITLDKNQIQFSTYTSPPNVTLTDLQTTTINLVQASTGDIFIIDGAPEAGGLLLNFPPDGTLIPIGTYWRLNNSCGTKVTITYNPENATLPNLDFDGKGSFEVINGQTIMLVKATGSKKYYGI